MLSPNNRIVLLPQDREIMDITGMSEEAVPLVRP